MKIKQATPEIHLLPENYSGKILIEFNQKNGMPPKFENNKILFVIDREGKCASQMPPNLGLRALNTADFHFIDKNNTKTKIPHYTEDNITSETVVVSDIYVIGASFVYFVDSLSKIHNYKNPSHDEQERQ